MKNNNSSRQIIIKDNSIAICLVLTAVLIVAGLILDKTVFLGEAGSLYADSIQPQMFRFKISTQSAQKSESVTAAAGLKPDGQPPTALSFPTSPAQEPVIAAPVAPIALKEETAAVVLPKGGEPAKTDSQPPPEVSEHRAAATKPFLKTIRGGRHPQYAYIVFECSGPIDYDRPGLQGEEIRLKIKNIETGLRTYRKYRTFDSWVRLNKADGDLGVSIGVPPGLDKFSDFLMGDPPRLVIHLYYGRQASRTETEKSPARPSQEEATPAGFPAVQVELPASAETKKSSDSKAGILTTMRGGRHPQYASIVFECSGPIDYDRPGLQGEEIRLKIKNIETRLRSYRKYRTFDSWVRLTPSDTDLDVVIGVLPGLNKFSDFLMENPPRLVINLYDKDN